MRANDSVQVSLRRGCRCSSPSNRFRRKSMGTLPTRGSQEVALSVQKTLGVSAARSSLDNDKRGHGYRGAEV
jgi:hypothetical protein